MAEIMPFVLTAFGVAVLATLFFRFIALRLKIIDIPYGEIKKHLTSVPLLGGVGLFVSFWVVIGYVVFFKPVFGIEIIDNSLGALFLGSFLLLLIGVADEIRPTTSPKIRLACIALVLFIVATMLPLETITNPFGGRFILPTLIGAALVFVWLLVTVMSTKLLDGVDGLAASVVAVGGIMISLLTLSKQFYQPNVAVVALIFVAVIGGFLLFNLPRASIFLGESGGLFIGFMIGGLSILAGSKIATALLVIAVPVLDVARVVWIRFKNNKPLMGGDRNHLHFVLIDTGWKEWQVLLLLVSVSTLFGLTALFLQSYQKIVALFIVAIAFIIFSNRVTMARRK